MNGQKDRTAVPCPFEKVFEKHGARFIPLKTLLNLLENEDLQNLGLKKNSSQEAVKTALSPLPQPYRFSKFKSSVYLFKGTAEDVAIDYIRNRKEKTFKQLNTHFPMLMDRFLELANQLLDQGAIKARLSKKGFPVLYVPETTAEPRGGKSAGQGPCSPKQHEPCRQGLSDVEIFKEAYDAVGKGSNYVFIYEIRRHLGWSRERFDPLLYRLMTDGFVAAHPGNPGALAADEVKDSIQDEFGDLYITVSWRKPI